MLFRASVSGFYLGLRGNMGLQARGKWVAGQGKMGCVPGAGMFSLVSMYVLFLCVFVLG